MTNSKIVTKKLGQIQDDDRHGLDEHSNAGAQSTEAPDSAYIAALLSADYPLIDSSLIYALLSDYDSSSLNSHLPEIRDQLAILEATIVPDLDDPINQAPSSSSPSSVADEVDLEKLHINNTAPTNGGGSSAPSSASSSKLGPVDMSRSGTSTSGTESTSIGDEEEFLDENELLQALFPSLSKKAITEALNISISLPAAIDHLLSVELIKNVEKEGTWPDEIEGSDNEGWQTLPRSPPTKSALIQDSTDRSRPPSRTPSQRSTRKKKTQRTIPLVDTLQRQVTPSSSRPGSRSSSRGPPQGPSSNSWHTMITLADHLSSLLPPTPPSHFLKFCHAPKYHSAYSAIRASLAALPSGSTKLTAKENEERSNSILEEIYGVSLLDGSGGKFQEDLEICVDITGGDVATVMDLMDLLDEISHWPGDDETEEPLKPRDLPTASVATPIPAQIATPVAAPIVVQPAPPAATPPVNTNRMKSRPITQASITLTDRVVPGSRPPPSSPIITSLPVEPVRPPPTRLSKAHKHPGGVQHIQNWREISHARRPRSTHLHPYASHIPSYARGALPHDSTPGSLHALPRDPGPSFDDCLNRARNERLKREEAVRNAGRHFKTTIKGKKHGALVAGHYASQAREAQEKARQWELKAARMVVQNQLASGGNTIDLHHLTILEAETLSREVAREFFGAGGIGAFGKPLIVVTGVGRHSAGGKGVLGPAVANVLEGDGYKVERGSSGRGYLVVRCRK